MRLPGRRKRDESTLGLAWSDVANAAYRRDHRVKVGLVWDCDHAEAWVEFANGDRQRETDYSPAGALRRLRRAM
jgi:hypothetical protein